MPPRGHWGLRPAHARLLDGSAVSVFKTQVQISYTFLPTIADWLGLLNQFRRVHHSRLHAGTSHGRGPRGAGVRPVGPGALVMSLRSDSNPQEPSGPSGPNSGSFRSGQMGAVGAASLANSHSPGPRRAPGAGYPAQGPALTGFPVFLLQSASSRSLLLNAV